MADRAACDLALAGSTCGLPDGPKICAGLVIGILMISMPAGMMPGHGRAHAQQSQPPGSRVAIDPPAGFSVAKRFTGFRHPSGASIVILEVAANAYQSMAPAMSGDLLAPKGIVDIKPLKLDRVGEHRALSGRQATPHGWFAKFMLLFRDERATALVTVNVPERVIDAEPISRHAVIKALESARLAPKPHAQAPMPYRLGYTGALQPAGRIAGGGLIYTRDGKLPTTQMKRTRPSFLLMHALSRTQRQVVIDIGVFGRRLINGLSGLSNITLADETKMRVAGLDGVRHRGTATSKTTGDRVAIYHLTLLDGDGGYYRLFGETPVQRADTDLAMFDRMANSFALTGLR